MAEEEIILTPEQETAYWQAAGEPKPVVEEEFNPLRQLNAAGLAKLAVDDPDNFDPVSALNHDKEALSDQSVVQNVADASEIIEQRGFEWEDIPEAVEKAPEMIKDVSVGFGKNVWNIVTGTVLAPLAGFVEKRYGKGLAGENLPGGTLGVSIVKELAKDVRQEQQRKVAESWAGTETAVTGLQQMAVRGAKKATEFAKHEIFLGTEAKPTTPEERVKKLFGKIGDLQTMEAAAAGKGPFMQAVGGEVIKELEEAGKPLRPEKISELAAGDFTTLWAFGKTFQGINKILPAGSRVAIAEATATAGKKLAGASGVVTQGAGKLVRLGGIAANAVVGKPVAALTRGAAAVAPAVGLVKGAIAGGPVGALAGLKGGEIASKALRKGATVVEGVGPRISETGKAITGWGAQVTGDLPLAAPTAQIARDVLQSAPGAAVEVGKGLGLDIGLAAATSETPQETQSAVGIGALFGAMGAARQAGGRIISGQLTSPRPWVSNVVTPSSRQFPAMDKMHSDAISIAPPGVGLRVNAIREFLKGAVPGADAFLGGKEMMQEALTKSGMPAEQARLYSEQGGFFTAELPGKDGVKRRIIGFTNPDSAPHEALHAFQDVLGESANRVIDEQVKSDYKGQWEEIGERYARRFKQYDGSGWREFVLDITGFGTTSAKEKMLQAKAEQIAGPGAWIDPASTVDLVAADWKIAVDNFRAANPGVPEGEVISKAWRGILSEAEAREVSDRYNAREIAAENFDAAFKNLGPSMRETKGIIPYFARIIGKTIALFGGEPLAGRTSEVGQIPLSTPTIEAVKGAVRAATPEVTPAVPRTNPIITTGGNKGPEIPVTPEQQAEAASEARAIADAAPEMIPVGGTKSTRELLGAVAEAIAQRVGMVFQYSSAKDAPAGALGTRRDVRRAQIEKARKELESAPESARALWPKNFFPERILQTPGGTIQVLGWAPEVFAANAHKLAAKLPQNLSPYAIDPATKTFTPEAWQELYADTQTFVENQMGGRTGAGEPLVVPGQLEQAGFFKPPVTGSAGSIEQRKADFISLLFGVPLPKTPRISGGQYPLNVAGVGVRELTRPGTVRPTVEPRARYGEFGATEKARAKQEAAARELGVFGEEIQEVNPLRGEIERAGIKLPELIEAQQRLNADRILEVELAPEQPQFRSNTLMMAAALQPRQFMPKPNDPRAIREAAVRDKEGNVFTGRFHGDAFQKAEEAGSATDFGDFDTGFIDNSGKWLSREQALTRADEIGQLSESGVEAFEGTTLGGVREPRLEATTFDEVRQFQPARERKEVEVTAPDGKKYRVLFDGYQDMSIIGRGMEPQFTALEDIPGVTVKGSTLYKKTLEDNGYKAPAELPAPDQIEPAGVQFQPPKAEEFESPDTVKEALSKPGWAILTATQEKLGPGTAEVNIKANAQLAAELAKAGYEVLPVSGAYKGEDQGANFLVLDITPEEAAALGKKYSQDSVLTPEGLLYQDGTITPARIDETTVGADAEAQDFYSTLPSGTSFSIPLDFSAEPQPKAQFAPKKKLPNSAGDENFDITHFSSQVGLKEISPKFFGKGKATPTDLRGAPKSYFFVKGSDFGQDANIFENAGLHAHETTVNGRKLYDLRKGKPDDLEWRKTINREEADNNVEDAGYDGIILDTADGRQVVAMFKPVKVGAGEKTAGQFAPRAEQEQLFGGRELLSSVELGGMNRLDLLKHFPEAVVPKRLADTVPSEIVRSPLYRTSRDPVQAFADKLVDFAKQYEDDPLYQSGKKWYSEFTPMLRKEFGADAPVMAELLAATSPQTNPQVNFGYALDALEGLKDGRFDKIIKKFNQGMEKIADGSWEKKAPTPARFLADWIEEHDLKPKQSNGKLYGPHSRPVLQVFARRWLDENRGPKTRNFVENLLGTSDEATIDLWADRTMRRIGYEGKERWRILPQHGTGVSDADFQFSQKAFRAAADKLGMKPSALQGALWFAEKSLQGKNGWSRLDLGDYRAEIKKAGLLRAGVKQREAAVRSEKKAGRASVTELPLVSVERRNLK